MRVAAWSNASRDARPVAGGNLRRLGHDAEGRRRPEADGAGAQRDVHVRLRHHARQRLPTPRTPAGRTRPLSRADSAQHRIAIARTRARALGESAPNGRA